MRTQLVAFFAVFFLCGTRAQSTLTCFEQKCRECPRIELEKANTERKCDPRSIMSASWLDELDTPTPYTNFTPKADTPVLEYACIKMTASNPQISGDNLDILRGCFPKSEAKSFCRTLEDLEKHRGKTDFNCNVCEQNLCNGSSVVAATLGLSLLSLLITAKQFFK